MSAALHEPFEDLGRQREAATFGMWVFLASEVLFFGSLILGFTIYRQLHPAAMLAAARETNIVFGSVNTGVLLTSSLTMAVADRAAERGLRRFTQWCLVVTALLGLAFLVIKGFEYAEDIAEHLVPGPGFKLPEPAAQLFFGFYWTMTAVHALHLTIGIVAVALFAWRLRTGALPLPGGAALPVLGLYWHLVDVIWVFLYPVLYLGGRT